MCPVRRQADRQLLLLFLHLLLLPPTGFLRLMLLLAALKLKLKSLLPLPLPLLERELVDRAAHMKALASVLPSPVLRVDLCREDRLRCACCSRERTQGNCEVRVLAAAAAAAAAAVAVLFAAVAAVSAHLPVVGEAGACGFPRLMMPVSFPF